MVSVSNNVKAVAVASKVKSSLNDEFDENGSLNDEDLIS
jgi:hypothetical protein